MFKFKYVKKSYKNFNLNSYVKSCLKFHNIGTRYNNLVEKENIYFAKSKT